MGTRETLENDINNLKKLISYRRSMIDVSQQELEHLVELVEWKRCLLNALGPVRNSYNGPVHHNADGGPSEEAERGMDLSCIQN